MKVEGTNKPQKAPACFALCNLGDKVLIGWSINRGNVWRFVDSWILNIRFDYSSEFLWNTVVIVQRIFLSFGDICLAVLLKCTCIIVLWVQPGGILVARVLCLLSLIPWAGQPVLLGNWKAEPAGWRGLQELLWAGAGSAGARGCHAKGESRLS